MRNSHALHIPKNINEVNGMKFVYDHDFHIHSELSSCSKDPKQNPERLLQYAKDNGLKKIVITDHFWDDRVPGASNWYKPQKLDHIKAALPLPQADGIEFLFGCETDYDKFCTVGVAKETLAEFSFIIIPTTHMHMVGFTISEEDASSNEARARLWITRLDNLFAKDLPFHKIGIAHLTCSLFNNKSREDYLATLNLIPDTELERVFKKAAELGVGIELNQYDMNWRDGEEDTVLRIYRTAKKMGCKFYLGSDSHHPEAFDKSRALFERAIDKLELTEDDKFIL